MSQRKSYHPSGMSWREREQKKEVERKEAEINAREEERLRKVRPTEENFPFLPGLRADPRPVTSSGLFAKLASDWKEQDDVDKIREEHRRQEAEREEQRRRSAVVYRPNYVDRQSWYVDTREEEEEEESHTPKYGNPLEDADGWITVETKRRVRKTPRQRYEEEENQEEGEEHNAELFELGNRDY